MEHKRITLFSGHYGSGKTNVAVNFALMLKREHDKVAIADLDIVNPYFRTKDSEKILAANGIRLISSEYAGSNVDLPALPAETYSILDEPELFAVIDVGGDDRGALALGRYAPSIIKENDFDLLFVVNRFRPLTPDAESAVEIMREIEDACRMRFTGIVNNSNLGEETTEENILSSLPFAEEIGRMTGLPIKMTTVDRSLFPGLSGKVKNLFPIDICVSQSWKMREEI